MTIEGPDCGIAPRLCAGQHHVGLVTPRADRQAKLEHPSAPKAAWQVMEMRQVLAHQLSQFDQGLTGVQAAGTCSLQAVLLSNQREK